MKKKQAILWVLLAVLAVAVVYGMRRVHFDWSLFGRQIRLADVRYLLGGVFCIYLGYVLRAVRWSVLLRPQKPVGATKLIGTQVVGFTAVALFGRLADLARPYLVARRANVSVASQVAVYAVERMFDALAMAVIFSGCLALSPDSRTLPHHEAFERAGILGLAVAIGGGLFAVLLRVRGEKIADMAASLAGAIHKPLALPVRERILGFRDGMRVLRGFGDFAQVMVLSFAMWGLILGAYWLTVHAFAPLRFFNVSRIMLMSAASLGGSALQLPIIGWFTQTGIVSAAMHGLGAPLEPAIGCAALLQIVTFMSVIPLGLIYARIEGISLRQVTKASEQIEEEIVDGDPIENR